MANCSRDVVIKDDHCLDVLKSFVDFGNIQLFARLELQNNAAATVGKTKYAVQICNPNFLNFVDIKNRILILYFFAEFLQIFFNCTGCPSKF